MASRVAHQCTGHGKIEAADPALPVFIHTTGHRNREDVIATVAHRLRQACVLPSKQQNVTRAALVFQNPDHQLLLPSTGSDLMLGMPQDQTAEQRWTRMAELLDDLGLTGLDRRPIHTLSGGQKQRLAIAGALASNAGLLLLDEPTALLDPDSQRTVLQTVHALCHQPKKPLTALWITHRLDELRFADGAAQMSAGRIGPWSSGPALVKHLRGGTPAR